MEMAARGADSSDTGKPGNGGNGGSRNQQPATRPVTVNPERNRHPAGMQETAETQQVITRMKAALAVTAEAVSTAAKATSSSALERRMMNGGNMEETAVTLQQGNGGNGGSGGTGD